MWVIKANGETFYVNHVDAKLPWTTKETPDNNHTKGSLKFKNALLTIDSDNNATLTELSILDKIRLRNQKLGVTRIMFVPNSESHKALLKDEFQHSEFKKITGSCSTEFIICDILDKKEFTFFSLKYSDFRVVLPNESYYAMYDSMKTGVIPVDYTHPSTPYEYS